jgi:hypothetical protein
MTISWDTLELSNFSKVAFKESLLSLLEFRISINQNVAITILYPLLFDISCDIRRERKTIAVIEHRVGVGLKKRKHDVQFGIDSFNRGLSLEIRLIIN